MFSVLEKTPTGYGERNFFLLRRRREKGFMLFVSTKLARIGGKAVVNLFKAKWNGRFCKKSFLINV
jgi:hypothetical protein